MSEQQRLPRTAYGLKEGEKFVPLTYGQTLTEFTFKSILSGAVLGMLFGAANTYLGLKAGLTISTSIPIAVLTVILFRALASAGKGGSILELNMSQTVGSASSSVASGLLFTIPALYLWNKEPESLGPPTWLQMALLGMAGGLLGVLAMIPLRRYLIKQEHGKLLYPEGMACAEVLVAATRGGARAAGVFWGIGAGLILKLLTGLKVVADKVVVSLPFKSEFSISVSPALIGVGYILGPRIATVMVAGSAISYFIIIPSIVLIAGNDAPFLPEIQGDEVKLISEMKTKDIWNLYVRYIGAGAVATGGIFTLIKSIPTMLASFRLGLAHMRGKQQGDDSNSGEARLDRDLSFRVVGLLVTGILLVLIFVPGILGKLDTIPERACAAVLVAIFAFFFVTVSSRIVGLVGVTSNPTSGMTIATVIGTSLIFYALGWTGMEGKVTALMVGTVVCTAASIAGDTSQDLKTGYVLGATPRWQQIGELLGVLTSAGVVALVLMVLDRTAKGGIGGEEFSAPQGTLMKIVISGVLDQQLPWMLILTGVIIATIALIFRLPVLAFAVGVYLPLYTMAAVFLGGMVRLWITHKQPEAESERRREQGVLAGSGFVGGEGLTGVLIAIVVLSLASFGGSLWDKTLVESLPLSASAVPIVNNILSAAAIVAIALFLRWQALRRVDKPDDASA